MPVQYADYAAWQRDRLSDDALEEHLDYWASQLAGVAPLELPTDRPRPAVRTSAGAARQFTVPAEVTARLQALARALRRHAVHAADRGLPGPVPRWSGQDDIAVGTVVTGRDRPELERVIGFFVNTVCCAAPSTARPPFPSSWPTCAGQRWTPSPTRMPRSNGGRRAPARTRPQPHPVVPGHGRAAWTARAHCPRFAGLAAEPVAGCADGHQFRHHSRFRRRATASLHSVVEYNTDLFDAGTVERMADQLVVLLAGIAADPDRPW